MLKVAVLIDGGHLRVLARQSQLDYNPDFIERTAHAAVHADESLFRVLYYDGAPFSGTVRQPISGEDLVIAGDDAWLKRLESKDLIAVRRGVLKFRGFKPRRTPLVANPPTDADFKPDFEQKGVDMRIGLDIANFASTKSVDRIILVSGDTDCVPAMTQARINGLQVVTIELPRHRLARELMYHSDFVRRIAWPAAP